MYDASAKVPTGILSGKSVDFGDYDECLEINTTGLNFKSKYCIISIHFSPSQKLYPNYYKIAPPNLTSSVPVWEAVKVRTYFHNFITIIIDSIHNTNNIQDRIKRRGSGSICPGVPKL